MSGLQIKGGDWIVMKDHEIAKIVNDLRDIARNYAHTEQLRNRIHGYIVPILKQQQATIEIDAKYFKKSLDLADKLLKDISSI